MILAVEVFGLPLVAAVARQNTGIEAAKARGAYKGRQPGARKASLSERARWPQREIGRRDCRGVGNYLGLIPVLVKGIQEQQDKLMRCKQTNEALKARLQLIERALKNDRASTRQRR
jgi:hypothetical protein